MTYAELLSEGQRTLEQAGIADARTDAWYLLSFVTGLDRARYLMRCGEETDGSAEKKKGCGSPCPDPERYGDGQWVGRYRRLIGQRAAHIPLQHLTGSQDFMGYTFAVTPDVLIPRQDTEVLVEEVLAALKEETDAADAEKRETGAQTGNRRKLLDLCTGSGCIAISCRLLGRNAEVTASDISKAALAVARKNAEALGADVRFVESDLFKNLRDAYDIIVSNPPYIPAKVIGTLTPEVKDHEPVTALDGGADGLDFYREIIKEAPAHLKEGGILFLEIGCDQAQAVSAILLDAGFTDIRRKKDLAGLDRVLRAVWKMKKE